MSDSQTKEQRVEVLLRVLQVETERARATSEQRRRNRALLRGFRAAMWAALGRASEADIEALMREELGLPAVTRRKQSVPVGTTEEVDSNDR
jgi:3-hydroxyacyl-CoA dehydrogenase